MSNDSDEIRRRMAKIRRGLGKDVETVVEQAKELADWKNLLAKHPFLTLSAAVAVGFLIVPKRLNLMSPDSKTLEQLAKRNRLIVKPKAEVRNRAGMISPIASLIAGAVMRGGLNMAGEHISNLLSPDVGPAVKRSHKTFRPNDGGPQDDLRQKAKDISRG